MWLPALSVAAVDQPVRSSPFSLYMDVVSGQRFHRVWLLFPIMLLPLTGIMTWTRQAIFQRDWDAVLQPAAQYSAVCGLHTADLRHLNSPAGEYHPTWGTG